MRGGFFGKPLKELSRDEWEILSSELYSTYSTKDAIVSAIHPLRLVLKFLGYSKEEIKELFPYPSNMHTKILRHNPSSKFLEFFGIANSFT